MSRPVRILLVLALLFGAGGLAVAAVAPAAPPAGRAAESIAAGLRCPDCPAGSVAASASPVAEAMRAEIDAQLSAGRTPAEIRAWFVERYGSEVLLDPGFEGTGILFAALPLATLVVLAVLLVRSSAGRRWLALAVAAALVLTLGGVREATVPVAAATGVDGTDRLAAAAAERPGDVALRIAVGLALRDEGRLDEALVHLDAAVRLRPLDADIGYLAASVHAEAGDRRAALGILAGVLGMDPDDVPALALQTALLLLEGEPQARESLARLRALAPEVAAATEDAATGDAGTGERP